MENRIKFLVKGGYLLVILLFWGCVSTPQNSQSGNSEEMILTWADEFDYSGAPDSTKWSYDLGNGCPNLCGWGNNELQTYTANPKNVRVENGHLIIEAHKDSSANTYTSTRLVSKNKGDFLYGRYEIKAKLPKGKGTWAAIWMLPTDWKYGGWPRSGEIDIMEFVGYEPDSIFSTVHTEAYNGMHGTQKGGQLFIPNASEEFQVYALDWAETKIDFFIDDQLAFSFHKNDDSIDKWPFDNPFHFIFNIAVGGNWGGKYGVDETIWPQKMLVDYIRVYQNESAQEEIVSQNK